MMYRQLWLPFFFFFLCTIQPNLSESATATRDAFPSFPKGEWVPAPPVQQDSAEPSITLVYFFSITSNLSFYELPFLHHLVDQYDRFNFNIIGIHDHVYAEEHKEAVIRAELYKHNFNFPVFLDQEQYFKTRLLIAQVPTIFLLDSKRNIRFRFDDTATYEAVESALRSLIQENNTSDHLDKLDLTGFTSKNLSLQISLLKLGTDALNGFGNLEKPASGRMTNYQYPENRPNENFFLSGPWMFNDQFIQNTSSADLLVRSRARSIILLASAAGKDATLKIRINGKAVPKQSQGPDLIEVNGETQTTVSDFKLYRIISHSSLTETASDIEINADQPVNLYELNLSNLDPVKIKTLKLKEAEKKNDSEENQNGDDNAVVSYTYQ